MTIVVLFQLKASAQRAFWLKTVIRYSPKSQYLIETASSSGLILKQLDDKNSQWLSNKYHSKLLVINKCLFEIYRIMDKFFPNMILHYLKDN